MVEVCSHHLHTEPEPPSERLGRPVERNLERILLDCLHKDPSGRPPSASVLHDRLLACADYGSWTAIAARQWWAEHGGALRKRKDQTPDAAGAKTIAVDFDRARST